MARVTFTPGLEEARDRNNEISKYRWIERAKYKIRRLDGAA